MGTWGWDLVMGPHRTGGQGLVNKCYGPTLITLDRDGENASVSENGCRLVNKQTFLVKLCLTIF